MQVGMPNLEGTKEKDKMTTLREEKKERLGKEQERKKKIVKMRKAEEEESLREVIVKIGLEGIDTQKEITVEALLDSRVTGLVISSEFARKKGFKLKKIENPIYVRNVDGTFNKEGPIENTVEVNIYYQGHRDRCDRGTKVECHFGYAMVSLV